MFAIFKTPKTDRAKEPLEPAKPEKPFHTKSPGFPGQPLKPESKYPLEPPKAPPTFKTPATNTTIIGKGLVFNGEVKGEGSVRVEGKFIGTLEVGQEAIIGEGGKIEGNIRANVVSVLGNVKGNVVAEDKITIDISGVMLGDIIAPRVVVAEGAVYKGRIDMEPKTLKSKTQNNTRSPNQPKKNPGKPKPGKPGRA